MRDTDRYACYESTNHFQMDMCQAMAITIVPERPVYFHISVKKATIDINW